MAVLTNNAPRDVPERAALDAGLRAPVQSEAAFLARFPLEMPPVDAELRALGIDPDSFYAAMGDCSSDGSQDLPGQVERGPRRGTRVRRRRRGERENPAAPEVMPSGWGMARGKAQRARAEVEDTVATVAVDEDGVEELVLEDDCPAGRMAHEDVKFGRIVIDTLTDDEEDFVSRDVDESDVEAEGCTNFTLDEGFDYDAPCSTAARGELSDWVPMPSQPIPVPEDAATEAEQEAAARAPDSSWRGLGASGVNDTANEPREPLEPFDPPLR